MTPIFMKKTILSSVILSLYSFVALSAELSLLSHDFKTLEAQNATTFTIYDGSVDSAYHFVNGAVMTEFHGDFYCMFQASQFDEDADDTIVLYAKSHDKGRTWSKAQIISQPDKHGIYTSGGWFSRNDSLIALLNFWPKSLKPKGGYTRYRSSANGNDWSETKPVIMSDKQPLNGIIEQDAVLLADSRLVTAAHFQPGLQVCPIWTDDSSGVKGWHKAKFSSTDGDNFCSVEMEPSAYITNDSDIIMTFRDQNSSFLKLAAVSSDEGETWSEIFTTDIPDARTKQCNGNLSDGRPFMVACLNNDKFRCPLSVSICTDGNKFSRAYIIRNERQIPDIVFEGKAKRQGYHYPKAYADDDNTLYVTYSTNKEIIEVTRIRF